MSSETTQSLCSPVPSERQLTSNAITVLEDRYLMRGDDGEIAETPVELFRRVANVVAKVEQQWCATPCQGSPVRARGRRCRACLCL